MPSFTVAPCSLALSFGTRAPLLGDGGRRNCLLCAVCCGQHWSFRRAQGGFQKLARPLGMTAHAFACAVALAQVRMRAAMKQNREARIAFITITITIAIILIAFSSYECK